MRGKEGGRKTEKRVKLSMDAIFPRWRAITVKQHRQAEPEGKELEGAHPVVEWTGNGKLVPSSKIRKKE